MNDLIFYLPIAIGIVIVPWFSWLLVLIHKSHHNVRDPMYTGAFLSAPKEDVNPTAGNQP